MGLAIPPPRRSGTLMEPCQAAPKMVAQCTDARLRRSSKLRLTLSRWLRHWARGGFAPGGRLLRWYGAGRG